MTRKYSELISGTAFLAFSIAFYCLSYGIKVYNGYGNMGVSARFLPQIMAVGTGILSLVLIAQWVFQTRRGGEPGPVAPDGDGNARGFPYKVILTAFCIAAYIFLVPYLGFLISTALYLFFQITLLAPQEKRKNKNHVITAAISIVFSAAVYYIFVNLFTLILPQGIFG